MTQPRYSFGAFQLDPLENVLLRDNRPIHLPPKAFETLLALVENEGHVLDKGDLLRRIWPDTFVEEATLAQNIFTLRKILGEGINGRVYIETVPKRGYRFVASVRVAEPAASVTMPPKVSRRRGRPSRRFWTVSAVALLLFCAAIWQGWQRFQSREKEPATRTVLAVIPFENLSGDPGQDYFCDGLTEELITKFGSLNPERLGVIARTTTMQYKGTQKNAQRIGSELGVGYIVEGSVVRGKERVRINAQLIRTRDQTHVWAQSYERDLGGALALQDDVSAAIADAVEFSLAKRVAAGSPVHGTLNSTAYDAYLRGRYYWNMRSEPGHLKAIQYFDQAIDEDPEYAQAYSGLADAYALLGSNPATSITRKEAMEKARKAALKAVSLDDSLAEAHTSLAFIYWHYDWNWPAAEKEFRLALALNPSYPTAHHWYAYFLMSQARTEQALDEIHHAQECDPLSLIINTDVAEILFYARRYDAAIQQAKQVLEMDPQFMLARAVLARSYAATQQFVPAFKEVQKGRLPSGPQPYIVANLAILDATTGHRPEARTLLLEMQTEARASRTGEYAMGIAEVYAALGDKDEAIHWLQKSFDNRDGGLTLVKLLPSFDSLHSDPRFSELVRRVGLP